MFHWSWVTLCTDVSCLCSSAGRSGRRRLDADLYRSWSRGQVRLQCESELMSNNCSTHILQLFFFVYTHHVCCCYSSGLAPLTWCNSSQGGVDQKMPLAISHVKPDSPVRTDSDVFVSVCGLAPPGLSKRVMKWHHRVPIKLTNRC